MRSLREIYMKVKAAIAPFYRAILRIFNFYCLTSAQSIRGAFSIQPNQFGKMMQDAELAGNSISVEEIGKIFVMVNFETDKVIEYVTARFGGKTEASYLSKSVCCGPSFISRV